MHMVNEINRMTSKKKKEENKKIFCWLDIPIVRFESEIGEPRRPQYFSRSLTVSVKNHLISCQIYINSLSNRTFEFMYMETLQHFKLVFVISSEYLFHGSAEAASLRLFLWHPVRFPSCFLRS